MATLLVVFRTSGASAELKNFLLNFFFSPWSPLQRVFSVPTSNAMAELHIVWGIPVGLGNESARLVKNNQRLQLKNRLPIVWSETEENPLTE